MTDRPCPICRAPAFPVGEKTGRRSGRTFSLSRCGVCGFGFVVEPWRDFATIYDERYYRGEGSDPFVDYAFEFEHPEATVRRYEWRGIRRIVSELVPADARWLDFGCGNGALVRHLRAAGHTNVFGIDTGAWAEKARAIGLPILRDDELDALAGSFDVITAIEVIEHVVDPLPLLARLRRLLKPGGWLFLTTGNAATAPNDFLKWGYVEPEIHVSYFTPQALADAMRQSGFAPEWRGRSPGWTDVIRFKILKSLGVSRVNILERIMPWPVLALLVDARFRPSAHPVGRAI